jgi:TetR/AcrR family transcriptional regulator
LDPEELMSHENAERIMDEAWKLFQQKGYRGVSMDELCLTAGLTKPTLYYYFHDKENLFVQVLQARLCGFREVIEAPGSLSERLEHIAASILENFQTQYKVL